MRQLDAELRRFFARRMVRGTFAIAVLIVLVSVGISTFKGHRSTSEFRGSATELTPGGTEQEVPIIENSADTRLDVGKSLEQVLEGTGVALAVRGLRARRRRSSAPSTTSAR